MLKIVISCIVLFSTVLVSIDAQIYAYGTILEDPVESFTCNKSGPICADDCSTLMLCAANTEQPFANVSCSKSSPSTPYCVGNTCSASAGNCTINSSFQCTAPGVFPDPTDCSRYLYCNESGSTSTIYVCPKGFIFNSKLVICQKGKTLSHTCNKVDCSQKTNEIVVYKSNPAYYSFCFVGLDGTRQTFMYKCDYGQIYDISENICKFDCRRPGYYQDPMDCNSYFICTIARPGQYKAQKIQCPTTYFFDGKTCSKNSNNCIPGSTTTTTTTTEAETTPTESTPTESTPTVSTPTETTPTETTPTETTPTETTPTETTPTETTPTETTPTETTPTETTPTETTPTETTPTQTTPTQTTPTQTTPTDTTPTETTPTQTTPTETTPTDTTPTETTPITR